MSQKLKVKKGDHVTAICGEDRGKSGKVLHVYIDQGTVVVEGINYVKKHMRKSEDNPQGGIVEKEAPIDVSNIKLDTAVAPKPAKKAPVKKTATTKKSKAE